MCGVGDSNENANLPGVRVCPWAFLTIINQSWQLGDRIDFAKFVDLRSGRHLADD